jgi:DNA-binding XRE family transcriptional regulator
VSIRYELDTSGPLHKIIKVVDATPPVLEPPEPTARPLTPAQAAGYLATVAAGLRADTQRRNRWGFEQPVPNKPNPERDLRGEDLRTARQAVGLSQRELAAEWGLARGLIGSIELGYRSCPLGLADWAKHVLRTTRKEDKKDDHDAAGEASGGVSGRPPLRGGGVLDPD